MYSSFYLVSVSFKKQNIFEALCIYLDIHFTNKNANLKSKHEHNIYINERKYQRKTMLMKTSFLNIVAFQDDGREEARGRHCYKRVRLRNGETRPFDGVHITGFHTVW